MSTPPHIYNELGAYLYNEIIDPAFLLYKDAARASANFIKKYLDTALIIKGDDPTWRFWPFVVNKADTNGLFLEFGVYKGKSLRFFAQHRPECVFYGFDSFNGLPYDWTGSPSPKGYYSLDENEKNITNDIKNIVIVEGMFEITLPEFIKTNLSKQENISFLHMDANLYEPTVFVLKSLSPYLRNGSVIVFDDFLNYPGYLQHEFKAFFEIIDRNFSYHFIAFQHMRAAIEIIDI